MRQLHSQVEEANFVFCATTSDIKVTAQPFFLEEQSSSSERQFVWAYKIKIENNSEETVQLLTRQWCIIDCHGYQQLVEGSGVVGEQPVIRSGEFFEYSSYTSLTAPSGIMSGEYKMTTDAGREFEVAIPAFSLESPMQKRLPN